MNKRIKKKILKSSNLKRQNNILNELSKHFTIQSKQFGNGYFMFSFGENTVCHFDIKETPNWRYGIWLEDNNKFEIFGEHEELIDKFKPSRCYVSYENNLKEFVQEVKNIAENPKLYFVDSLNFGYAIEKYQGQEREDYVNKEYEEYQNKKMQELKDIEHDRKYSFKFFEQLITMNNIVAVGINDKNKGGWKCSPRYDIKIVVDSSLTDEEFNNIYDKLDGLIREKSYADEVKTHEHRFDLYGLFDELEDIKNCDYKYYKEGV